jgi:mevalonate kinase
MTVRASSPGNLFLCGEHAVVYGYPAITCSVERRTTVSLTSTDSKMIRIVSDTCGKIEAELTGTGVRTITDNEDLRIFMELIATLPLDTGFDAHITSDIPLKSGMSSPTAVLSSFLMACSEEYGLGIHPTSYYERLLPVQRAIHGGKASGSEIFSSSMGGFHHIRRDGNAVSAKRIAELDLDIIIADTGVFAPTHLTVGYHIPSLIERKKEQVYAAFDAIGHITDRMSRALAKGDVPAIGALMDENQAVLKALGVSHPKLDDCVSEAKAAGALGAKLSGSGWGGIMFALVQEDTKEQVKRALESTWARVITTTIGGQGVRLEE